MEAAGVVATTLPCATPFVAHSARGGVGQFALSGGGVVTLADTPICPAGGQAHALRAKTLCRPRLHTQGPTSISTRARA